MEENSLDKIQICKIFGKFLILELIISLLGMFVLALILSKTSISDDIMGNCIIGISGFSIAVSAFLCSRKVNIKGIICGAIQGIMYMMILYVFSSILNKDFSLSIESIIMILFGIISGSVGGIIGANFKKAL